MLTNNKKKSLRTKKIINPKKIIKTKTAVINFKN